MARTISLLGIKAPNAAITIENVIRGTEDRTETLAFAVSPGAEAGIDKVAKKHGYTIETSQAGKAIAVRLVPEGKKLEEIDVTGDTCPGPAITVGNYLGKMTVGDRVKVKSGCADAIEDIAMAVRATGSKVVEKGGEGDKHYLIAEKALKVAAPAGAPVEKDKLLIVQSNGIGNAEKAYATFIFSRVALSMGKKVTIFMLMDGASIGRKGTAAGVKHPAFERLDKMMEEVIKAGAKVYVCELSAQFRGIKQKDLVEGVKLAGAATYLELLSDPSYTIANF
ncbi:DsrE family protein [Methanocella sp. MCL-LM]|uniref:DsrE family protein n=1 Tax=Methanocella sp. MCL-LM TaxID=3412035 RepID=UPI003C792C3A